MNHSGLQYPGDVNLSSRAKEVLRLVTHGLQDKEIAQQLHLSTHYIGDIMKEIRGKLKVTTRTGAAMLAQQYPSILHSDKPPTLGGDFDDK